MKASKFTDAQKAFVIEQGEEGTPVAEVCRKAGITERTNAWQADEVQWNVGFVGRSGTAANKKVAD